MLNLHALERSLPKHQNAVVIKQQPDGDMEDLTRKIRLFHSRPHGCFEYRTYFLTAPQIPTYAPKDLAAFMESLVPPEAKPYPGGTRLPEIEREFYHFGRMSFPDEIGSERVEHEVHIADPALFERLGLGRREDRTWADVQDRRLTIGSYLFVYPSDVVLKAAAAGRIDRSAVRVTDLQRLTPASPLFV